MCSLSIYSLVQALLKAVGRGTVKDSHVRKTSQIKKYIFMQKQFLNHSKHAYYLSQHFKLAKKGVKFTAVSTFLSV